MRPWEHPANIVFTEEDFAAVRDGSVITKVVVLERPDKAEPVATTCDSPFEITVPPNRDPMIEAQQRGRPLLVLHMGDGQASPQELASIGVPGTVLLPGECMLPPPRDPPSLPWMCWPAADPRAGLLSPAEEICFHDGGDEGLPVGQLPDRKLVGLDPSDTVAQYIDNCGIPKIAISNKVCLCVPRYLLVRNAISISSNVVSTAPGNTLAEMAPVKAKLETLALEYNQKTNTSAVSSRIKASALINLEQVQVVGQVEGVDVYATVESTGNITGTCLKEAAECANLVIFKWPDKCDVHLGEIVRFYLRYQNKGRQPITNVIVSDSLTGRLEYVPDSARSDRDALFTTTPNEAGSHVLRWEITGSLPGGQFGTMCFDAIVR
jgi:uncharacterized repeat protein (TIGR01451 family)